jgi:hypothetical protein
MLSCPDFFASLANSFLHEVNPESLVYESRVNRNCKITITSKFDDDLSVRNELLRRLRWKFVYEVWRL